MITWLTDNDLGVVSEDFDTDITVAASTDGGTVFYTLLNGDLPYGLSLFTTGRIYGRAQNTSSNSVHKFTVRASATNGGSFINDRTFSITVQGEHAPVITTVGVNLGQVFTGESFSFQFRATDADLEDSVTFYLASGRLPLGLALDKSGLLSGTVVPSAVTATTKTYNFRIGATDTKSTVFAPYSIKVANRAANTTDNSTYRASSTVIRADANAQLTPVILNTETDLGIHKSDDRFSYKIDAYTYDYISVTYSIASGALPPNLSLHANTGWIEGYLPPQIPPGLRTYNFSVAATSSVTTLTSPPKSFTISVDSSGAIPASAWAVSSTLPKLRLGDVSTIDINPHTDSTVVFRLQESSKLTPTINLITSNSDAFDGGSWVGYCGSTSNVTFNTTDIAAPNGTFTATKIIRDSNAVCGSGSAWGLIWGLGNVTVGVTYTISMWVRAPAAINGCLFGFNDVWGGLFNITTTWQRVTYTGVLADSGNGIRGFQFTMPAGSGTAYFWGAQLEANSFATPYGLVPTGTSVNPLPPNLQLLENGLIVGRVSFTGVMPADTESITYKFVVEMRNSLGTVIGTKEFSLEIDYQDPYETLYLQVFPKKSHRALFKSIIENTAIIPLNSVYRYEDSYFGLTKQFKMLAVTGLTPDEAAVYIANSSRNHRRRASYIQEINWAIARDRNSELIYEVVYGVLKDREENEFGVSAPVVKSLNITSQANITVDNPYVNTSVGRYSNLVPSPITVGQTAGIKSYPPSYDNMRSAIKSKMTMSSTSALPFWLSTLQPSGATLADTNVIPLVYVKVGQGATIVENIVNAGIDFSTIPFDVDGYVWDDYQEPEPVAVQETFQFENGGFEAGVLTDLGLTATTPGWTVYKSEVRLGGVSTILNYPTPVDPTPTPTGAHGVSLGDNASSNNMTYTATLTSDTAPVGTSKKSLRLISNGSTNTGYAVVHGPYAVNNTAIDIVEGDIVEFWWKAQGGSDAYDIFAYLLNTSNGNTIVLLNDTGNSTGATTPWTKVSRGISLGEDGNYKFIFVSGTFDYTGGKILGASLYIDEVNVIKAQPIANTSGLTTKYLKFTGPGQWPWTPNRGVQE